jgi:hypothetical protein
MPFAPPVTTKLRDVKDQPEDAILDAMVMAKLFRRDATATDN